MSLNTVVIQLLHKKFFLMFIPKYNVVDKKIYKEKLDVGCSEDIAFYDEFIAKNRIVVFENGLGSFVFANIHTFDVFQILQKKHKDIVSYVFCADGEFGYFKILECGRIVRKVASFGQIDGISSYPETRGIPCRFETEKNKIFKIDGKAIWLVDALKNFNQQAVSELIDYYIGFGRIAETDIERTYVYELKD